MSIANPALPYITGSAISVGTFMIALTANDAGSGTSVTVNVPLVVNRIINAITIDGSTTVVPKILAGSQFSAMLAALNTALGQAAGTQPLTWSSSNPPVGIDVDRQSGLFFGQTVPDAAGDYPITLTATDYWGATFTRSLTITVVNGIKAIRPGEFAAADSTGDVVSTNLIASYIGDGSDGDFVCNGTNTCPGTTLSFGVNIAQRDLFLNKFTSAPSGKLNMLGFNLYILDTETGWDVTNAPVGAVVCNGGNGNGSLADATPTGNPLYSFRGRSGVAGTTSAGVAGVSMPTILTLGGGYGGGATGTSGKGGAGTAGASGAAGSRVNWTYNDLGSWPVWSNFTRQYPDPAAGVIVSDAIWAGAGGASGSPGAGSGAAVGGASGAGGNGGGRLVIRAGAITTSASTPAGVVQCNGGLAGNGVAGGGTGRGGGGGGFGGGGGYLFVYYGRLDGPAVADFAWADGGDGGTGGAAGGGAGTAGVGGQGGIGGRVYMENPLSATSTSVSGILGVVPTAPTTTAAGADTHTRAWLM